MFIQRRTMFMVAMLAAGALGQGRGDDGLRADIDLARARIYPALVNISVVARVHVGGRVHRAPAAGSGVVVSPAGHVLTNYHVAGDAARIVCTLPTGESIPAEVLAHDPATDLSVLTLRLDARVDRSLPLPFATLGDSAGLSVGDWVLAVGNPLTLSSSLTLGVVSNTRRVFTDFTGTELEDMEIGSGEKTGMFTRWIQHDALILPGNSGGPLVSLRGEIVGINTRGGNGVGFATPSNLVAKVLNQVLTYGKVRRGWLGIAAIPVAKLGRRTGALVSAVLTGSPAHKAGIAPGDIVLSMNDEPVTARFFEEVPVFYERVADLEPGARVKVVTERGGEVKRLEFDVGLMERSVGEEAEFRDFGLTVQDITAPMALARRMPNDAGVLITGVRAGYPFESAQPKVQERDVVTDIDGTPVVDLAGFTATLAAAQDKGEFAVTVRRHREVIVTVIKTKSQEKAKKGGELPRAWLGLKTQVVTPDVAKALGLPEGTKGVRVTEILPWTTAAAADLAIGDVIVAFDGAKLDTSRSQDAREFQRRIEDRTIGETIDLAVVRGAAELSVKVTLEESPLSTTEAKRGKNLDLEIVVRDITFTDRVDNDWEKEQMGAIVVEATSGGWAHMAGLRAGDLVVTVNDLAVTDAASFEAVMATVAERKPKSVAVYVRRGYGTTFVIIEPDWSKGLTGK